VWQPALWIRASLEPRMNADITAEIRLYLNLYHIITIEPIITVICVHLCLSAVNNEIEIIPAYFLSAHVLSVGCGMSVRAAASGVGGCCRWEL